jgi:hypothetical protein
MELVELQQEISRELTGGERLLWSGQPRQGLMVRASDAVVIPFSLFWAGFAFFWEATALRENTPLLFKLWGIPFVLIGIYFVAGRFFADAWMRKRTAYGVTNQRVIIVTTFRKRNVQSIALRSVPETSLSESGDGSGTITLGPAFVGRRGPASPKLEGIQRVRSVYDMICEAQKSGA